MKPGDIVRHKLTGNRYFIDHNFQFVHLDHYGKASELKYAGPAWQWSASGFDVLSHASY